MKAMQCELCGSTDILKDGDYFVCQNCGTKYTPENAKKMMVEGVVQVEGTVKVDVSAQIENYLTIAKRADGAGNKKEAEEYCNKVLEIDPENYNAWLLKGKSVGWQSTIANPRIDEATSCFLTALEHAPTDDLAERDKVKQTASDETIKLLLAYATLACNNYASSGSVRQATTLTNTLLDIKVRTLTTLLVWGIDTTEFSKQIAKKVGDAAVDAWNNHIASDYRDDEHRSKYVFETFIKEGDACISLIDIAISFSTEDDSADIQRYKNMASMQRDLMNACSWTFFNGHWIREYAPTAEVKAKRQQLIKGYHEKIKAIDPSYEIPAPPSSSDGCYVATAVYGSYDCPQVWTLRRYRDFELAESFWGRAFIKTYYAISPTLVKWFGETDWFKRMWRGKLDRMVSNLQARGFSSAPYKDRSW